MSTARGKIGRLPVAIRDVVNRMIRDNATAAAIQRYLAGEGVDDVSPQNISSWKSHGYQGWLRIQQRLDGMRIRRESAEAIVGEMAGDDGELNLSSNATALMAVDTIQDVLEDFDPTVVKELVAEKPAKFFDLVDALGTLRKGDHAFVKVKMAFEQYRARVREKMQQLERLANKAGVATKEDINRIVAEVYGTG